MKKAFITGINGFVGSHLSALLQREGYALGAMDQAMECMVEDVSYYHGNILDGDALCRIVEQEQPQEIYHLAAVSYLPDADASPAFALHINIIGVVTLLDAVRKSCPGARVLLVGSSKEYNADMVSESVDEQVHPDPTNFYGISKYAGELIGRQYVRQYGIDVRFTRSFNHTGPGQSPKFVCSDWARQAATLSLRGEAGELAVGDLNAEIDFTDVRDVVRAYHAILTRGRRGEVYNVCSGDCVPLQQVLDFFATKAGVMLSAARVEAKSREHRTSVKLAGSNWKLVNDTGWRPQIALRQTLEDLYAYWYEQLARSSH